MRHAARAALAALVWAGFCGFGAQANDSGTTVQDAWIFAAPPGTDSRPVYAEIYSENGDVLVDFKSPAAAGGEVHLHHGEDGAIMMTAPGTVDIPEKSTVVLTPGGKHVVLFGLKQTLEEGAEIPVTFIFQNAGEVEAAAAVRPAEAQGEAEAHVHSDHEHGGWFGRVRSIWERLWPH